MSFPEAIGIATADNMIKQSNGVEANKNRTYQSPNICHILQL